MDDKKLESHLHEFQSEQELEDDKNECCSSDQEEKTKRNTILGKISSCVYKNVGRKVIGNTIKLGFWTAVWYVGPITSITSLGPVSFLVLAVVSHSGIVEYYIV